MGPITTSVKRFLPKSLLGRSLLIIVTPLVVLQLVSAGIFYETHWDKVTSGWPVAWPATFPPSSTCCTGIR